MDANDRRLEVDEALEQIEESILPSLSLMLDALLDAAALARPGHDAEAHAAELRTIALQLEELTRQVEAISPSRLDPEEYRLQARA